MSTQGQELAALIEARYSPSVFASAASIAEFVIAAGYEKRPDHVHSWMTEHGGTQVCHNCRESRERPPMSDEDGNAARAYFDALRKQRQG